MRVLVLAPTLPWPLDAGGRIRTYHLLRELAGRHELHLWAVRQPEAGAAAVDALREVCAKLRVFERSLMPIPRHWLAPAPESWFHSADFELAVRDKLAGEPRFDLIHVDELSCARPLFEGPARPALLHHHKLDLELARALHGAGELSLLETMRWRTLEELAARRFEHHVFCTRRDAERFLGRHPDARPHVVPNAADLEHFTPRESPRDADELLFLGSLDYAPNQLGLGRFLERVWPGLRAARPRLSLVVVGRAPAEDFKRAVPEGVHLIPDVEDVRPFLARAAALVVPLEIGGGSRLKIAEALAMGCPVVSTRVGAEGFEDREGVRLVEELDDLERALLETPTPPPPGSAPSWHEAAACLERAWQQAAEEAS